ncbi:hypothetical protein EXIGLDRAFT_832719 [Exidia glandulosa HHB12029]|uniref:BTB domain-containing protein n=1 Tax=Exidia glandulosa HHB12029 TaxID=1314781 RepID=A0A165LD68_EXIGL|nr:hypothetical protein EXIGLDRAFT_832719 [Exidia glandulosa HHB12029]
MSTPQRDATLWFDDGNLVLQAEMTTFKVSRSFICRESEFFAGMHSLDGNPLPAGGQDGTEERPLLLLQVSAPAFANILRMLYTVWGAELEFDKEELIAMLRVAHRLLFTGVHAIVAKLLHPLLSSERRLHLGITTCGVEECAFPAFAALVYAYDVRPENCDPPFSV